MAQKAGGRILITYELLATLLNLPKDVKIIRIAEERPAAIPDIFTIYLVGDDLPIISEGEEWPLVDQLLPAGLSMRLSAKTGWQQGMKR